MKKKLTLAISALIATLPALAQNQNGAAVEEVLVTGVLERQAEAAGRLGLTNRETPAIIDVITQQELPVQGVRNAIEAMNAAPGVASGTLKSQRCWIFIATALATSRCATCWAPPSVPSTTVAARPW